MTAHPGRGATELLEREAEQADVAALLDQAAGGAGGLLVLEGPAGIGKTRLLTAAIGSARERGLGVGRARGGSLEQEFAFGAVRQLLEPLVAEVEDVDRLFSGAAAAAAPVLGRGDLSAPVVHEPGIVLHGLYWLTAALAEGRPLALFCDDAHWFDGPSLRFVAYLANRVEELPIAIVVGTRPPEPGPEGELLSRLIGDQGTTHLMPAPLTEAAVATLVRQSLDAPADPAYCRAVADASKGNPFLVGELVRAARNTGASPDTAAAARVTEQTAGTAMLTRLGRLPAEALELARAVAILGADAQLRHAAALADLEVERAADAADVLLRAEILGPERPLAFVHPLVATAVHDGLLPGDRSNRHRRAARLLMAEGAPADRVATHLLVTDPVGDPEVVEALAASARWAVAHGATDVAVAYLQRALEEPPTPEVRLGIVLELGAAEVAVTDPAAVDHLYEAIAGIPDPATRVMLAMARGICLALEDRPAEAMAGFDELAPDVADDPALAAQLLAGSVLVGMTGPDARPLAAQRIEELCALVPPGAEGFAPSVLGVRSFVGAFRNEPAGDMADLAERALAELSPDDPTLPVWFHLPLVTLVMADRDRLAAEIVEEGLAIARRLGAPAHLGVTLFMRAWIALRAGELDDAEADARESLEALSLHGVSFVIPGPIAILVDVLRERDDLPAAEALLAEWGYATGDGTSLFHLFLLNARGRLRYGQERWDEVYADLRRGHERTIANGCTSPAFLPWDAHLVGADMLAFRTTADTRARATTALELADTFGSPRARAEALRAVAWADPDADPSAADEAARLFGEVGAKIEEARTIIGLAYSRRGKIPVGEIRALAARGFELADQTGSPRLRASLDVLLAEVGEQPTRRVAVSGLSALTPSERRVAALASTGRSNKDVAQELFVTVKTVETHLAHAYQKLGITRRAELQGALVS